MVVFEHYMHLKELDLIIPMDKVPNCGELVAKNTYRSFSEINKYQQKILLLPARAESLMD